MASIFEDHNDEYGDFPDEVAEIYKLRKDSSKHQSGWRVEARESFEFRDGDQWDSTDRAALEEQNRPAVTFNRIAPILDSIVGHEMGNRQEVRYLPRTPGDETFNEIYTAAAQWVMDRCDGEDEESDAYLDALTCGMGWTEIRVDYEEEPEGKIVKERVPPLQMRWDPATRKNNIADANWVIREKWLPIEELKDRWPGKAKDIKSMSEELSDTEWLDEHDSTHAWQYEQDSKWWDPKSGKALLIHYQYREKKKTYRVWDPVSQKATEFPESRFQAIKKDLDGLNIPYVSQQRWVYKQRFITGDVLLEEGDTPVDGSFSYHAITAKRDEEEGWWYGMVRVMHDPQEWANKFFSQAMYIFNSNAKGGVLAEEDAVSDMREFEERWASSDAVNWVNPGSLGSGKIQQKDFGGYPSSLDKLMAFAISSIRDCSGVNLELLGMANRDQPGVLEVERKKAALVVLAPLINSLRRYRKMSGRTMLSFIRRYIPEGTMMRITDKAVQFTKDDDVVEYDVIVDTAPSSPNLKTEVWQILQNMLPALLKQGTPIPPSLIKFSPLPEAVAQEWIEYIEKNSQFSPDMPEQMQKMQEEMARLQQENQQLQSKREQYQAELAFKRENARLEAFLDAERMAMEERRSAQDRIAKMKMSDADRAAKLIQINAEYEAKMEQIRVQSECERDVSQQKLLSDRSIQEEKIRADHENQVISIQAEREKRRIEQGLDSDMNRVDTVEKQVEGAVDAVEKVSEKFDSYVEEAAQRRQAILEYLRSQGGEVAQLASRLT